ncbi:MAG: FAD-dependent monooxygenase, partial [Gemmatimonadaceae bacterium]
MLLDARTLDDGATLDTDVCIVGAGPAGLVLGAELSRERTDVVMLESGGDGAEPNMLALNDGDHEGDEYAGLRVTRHRQVGGTTHLWNTLAGREPAAKYAPLDAADFEDRSGRALSGWPFGLDELRDDYAQAQRICGLGPFTYDAAAWRSAEHEPWSELAPSVVSRVYQLGTRRALLDPLRSAIHRATNVRLYAHATA